MSIELAYIGIGSVAYVTLIFLLAQLAERGIISTKITSHPLVYVLSLGVFASSWAYYGIIELAQNYGLTMLTYYIGTGALFLFGPQLLKPVIRLTHRFGLRSMVDMLAFRFPSPVTGALVTLIMIIGILPLLVLQVQSVADAIQILTLGEIAQRSEIGVVMEARSHNFLALVFTLSMAAFAMLFGSGQNHRGLYFALATESLIKLAVFLALGATAVFTVFKGFQPLENWLVDNPVIHSQLYEHGKGNIGGTMLLLFISTAITMPHVFRMGVIDGPQQNAVRWASWVMPLYLLLMALPVLPIYWAGNALGLTTSPEYWSLELPLALGHEGLAMLAYMGGIAAATGAMIAIILALASVFQTHIILPLTPIKSQEKPYFVMLWLHRFSVLFIAMCTYLIYRLLDDRHGLSDLAFTSFIQTLQFLPAFLAMLLTPRCTSKGMILGLTTGTTLWLLTMVLPLLFGITDLDLTFASYAIPLGRENWQTVGLLCLSANVLVMIIVSSLDTASTREQWAAEQCATVDTIGLSTPRIQFKSFAALEESLARSLGPTIAKHELASAMTNANIDSSETRLLRIAPLKEILLAQLSKLLGPNAAASTVEQALPYTDSNLNVDIAQLEESIEHHSLPPVGLVAELDQLRKHHRNTLDNLPLGACVVDQTGEILFWNRALSQLTNMSAAQMLGKQLNELAQPWLSCFDNAIQTRRNEHTAAINIRGRQIHLRFYFSDQEYSQETQAILVEDITEQREMADSLQHRERLAAVGKLAAGVAHEIGNPVTGIACLAQEISAVQDVEFNNEAAKQILTQTQRITGIVQSLVNFSHTGEVKTEAREFERVSLNHCVDQAIQLLRLDPGSKQVRFHNEIGDNQVVQGSEQKLIQVFVNLLGNAKDASPDQGDVKVVAETSVKGLEVSVIDQGAGIDSHDIDHLMEPFFTTKPVGEGTGLGLSLVYSILQEHDAEIEFESFKQNPLLTGTVAKIIFSH